MFSIASLAGLSQISAKSGPFRWELTFHVKLLALTLPVHKQQTLYSRATCTEELKTHVYPKFTEIWAQAGAALPTVLLQASGWSLVHGYSCRSSCFFLWFWSPRWGPGVFPGLQERQTVGTWPSAASIMGIPVMSNANMMGERRWAPTRLQRVSAGLGGNPVALLCQQCTGKDDPQTGNVALVIKFQIFSN